MEEQLGTEKRKPGMRGTEHPPDELHLLYNAAEVWPDPDLSVVHSCSHEFPLGLLVFRKPATNNVITGKYKKI